jgi:D-psicose/D-tagatose/L-ribulose 3-epimerase
VDTYHMNIEESDLFSPVLDAGDRIGYVHIGESTAAISDPGQSTYTPSSASSSESVARADHLRVVPPPPWSTRRWAAASPPGGICGNDSADLGAHACTFVRNKARAVETINLY